jgi:translation initiation factor IF-2
MGSKIKISDLARMMNIANQDLVFKLRSLGVRVEGEEAQIDTDAIQAIMQGKKLPQPREVILRDETAPPVVRRPVAAPPPPPTRRPTPSPLRPNRPRSIIQTVEPRIRTLDGHPERVASDDDMPMGAFEGAEAPYEDVYQASAEAETHDQGTAVEAFAETPSAAPVAETASAPAEPAAERPAAAAAAAVAPAVTPVATPEAGEKPTPPPPPPPPPPPKPPEKTPDQLRTGLIAPPPPGYQPPPRPGRPGTVSPPGRPGMGPGGRPGMGPGGPSRPGMGGGPSRPGMGPSGPPRPGMGGGPSRPGMGGGPSRPGMGGGPTRPGMGGGPTRPGMGGGPSRPGMGGGPTGPGGMRRPGSSTSPAPPTGDASRQRERDKDHDKKNKRGVKKQVGEAADNNSNLRSYRGSLREIEAAQDDGPAGPVSARRARRAEREKEGAEAGKVLSFKKPPSGSITITEGMTLRQFSDKLGAKSRDVIASLVRRGILANINQVIEPELANQVAMQDFGVETMLVSFEEEVQLNRDTKPVEADDTRPSRAPVVTIMGHVDHGKTSLLDAIRSSKVAEGESGGITQHIGAYDVEVHGRRIVFLDTPGHEAFTLMRARGAKATDLVVLVVAADDGVMPQTIEAISHARAAKVPLIVAINKIDKPNANLDRVKKELSDRGVLVEDWGGDTVAVPISALKKQGIKELLEMIVLQADILDLKANPDIPAQGVVLEARKDVGRGIIATVLVQDGTLAAGDIFVCGATWGRVRSMSDDVGKRVTKAGPATPTEITGFGEVPDAGDLFQVVAEEEKARAIAEFRQQEARKRGLNPTTGKLSLEQLFSQIQQGEVKDLAVVLKADVQGSVEVLKEAIEKQSTDKVRVQVLHSGVGAITTNDVLLASASKAIVVGFNVRPERNAADLAEHEKVDIRLHTIIYELLDELKLAMTGLLSPTFKEVARGRAEVRDTFKVPKVGTIAGCHVIEGVIPRTALIRLVRDGRVIYEGKLSSLRRFKDDASEVRAGFDCGIGLDKFQDFKPGDFIEAFVKEQVAATL